MKKMTLVEKATMERLNQKRQSMEMFHPEEATMLQLQTHIEQVLKSSKLSEDEKVRLLMEAKEKLKRVKEAMNPLALAQAEGSEVYFLSRSHKPVKAKAKAPAVSDRTSSGSETVTPGGKGESDTESDTADQYDFASEKPLGEGEMKMAPSEDEPTGSEGEENAAQEEAKPLTTPTLPPRTVKTSSSSTSTSSGPNIFATADVQHPHKEQYKRFQKFVNAHPGLLDKTKNGEIVIDGRLIPNSNFDHLMKNMYKTNDRLLLTGKENLAIALGKAKISTDLVSDRDFRERIKVVLKSMEKHSPQGGKGFHKRKRAGKPIPPPPGKRPKVLFLYH